MLRRLITLVGLSLIASTFAALAQDNAAPAQQSQNPATTAPRKDQKKPADANQFPEAQSEQAAQQAQQVDSNSAPSAAQPQTAPQKKPSTADANPFPEAQSEKAAHQAEQPDSPAPSSSSLPHSSDDNYSSSRVKGLELPEAAGAPASADTAAPMVYNPKLARKDAQIGDFYLESGDYKGAYDRFLEANRSDPGNAEAVFGLADSARHLHLRDEALRNYRLYLSALPNGPHAKEIRKALKDMGADPPS